VSTLLDARGCLTETGLVALDGAPPGQGPADAAAHLAGCTRCQRRFLARGGQEGGGISLTPRKAVAPPLWRTGVVVLGLLALVAMALMAIRIVSS
jgi:hypothetical protein